jgi:hypothetical protein
MPTNAVNRILQGLLLGGLCQVAPVWASGPEPVTTAQTAVGQVNLVLGKAFIVHADGDREAVKTGLAISVGDRVETQGNAHVHIRFVDNELISVRPLSRLEIQRYDYHADDPAASVVKFNLIEGVTRAVSGDAAKSARQNFRLNTPVAAIGVRGTDFVVSADQREARALVNEGAIIMAPFSTTCLAEAFGPCTDNGLELSGGNQQMALVVADATEPVLVAVNGGGATESFLAGAAVRADGGDSPSTASESGKESGNDPYTESVSSRVINEKQFAVAPEPEPEPELELPPKFTPDAPLPEEVLLTDNQLVWGRWGDSTASRDLMTVSWAAAKTNRNTTVLGGNYQLYRTGDTQVIQQGLPVMAFDLKRAQAFFTGSDGVANPVDVNSGELSIDFNHSQYSTTLDLSQQQMGDVNFSSHGSINPEGMFHDLGATKNLKGAVSLDGKEAGYYFDQKLQNGLLEGLTLWGSAP